MFLVFSCGTNFNGELGQGLNDDDIQTFQSIESLSDKNIISVYAGNEHVFALTQDGKVYGWYEYIIV